MRTLKGPKGSQVKLGVKRMGEKDLLSFTITRGDIPQNTVDAAYMLNDEIGYVKVSKFGRTSHVELLNALAQLNHKKCKGLIIDLRGNTGGYMEAAIRMVNEFLPEGKLIVYTQGRKYPRAEEFANGTGSCQKMPLVVLIDEGSASASEIFTGAIQDNDRGTVVGRRSFGKGLVQQPIDFSDGSAIRLTIARYYTPQDVVSNAPTKAEKTVITNWIYSTVTNTVNSSHATVSSKMKTNFITPASDVLCMVAVALCRIYSYRRIPQVSPHIFLRLSIVD